MSSILLLLITVIAYIVAYHTYGKWIGRKILQLTSFNKTPARSLHDAIDFVPTSKGILFGHHFTTIAGTGPIVGPAIAVIWGWGPAFLWILIGPIFAGAVHDMMSLVISSRHNGQTVGELSSGLISPRVGFFFQILVQMLLWIFVAVLAIVIALLFEMYPRSVLPIWAEIPIALWAGHSLYEKKRSVLFTSLVAVGLMYFAVFLGISFPITLPAFGPLSAAVSWMAILMVYGYFASIMPVQKLLQPRDYINAHELWIAMILLVAGIIVGNPEVSAPFFQQAPGAPHLAPSLFIIIACGAISGFHAVTSSGTTVRQLENEEDALFIGYGGMLMEGILALVVVLAITAGLTMEGDREEFLRFYRSWDLTSGAGLKAQLGALVEGGTNLMAAYGMPKELGRNIITVFIVSFASTSFDSAIRLQRFGLKEILQKVPALREKRWVNNRFILSLIVIVAAIGLCMITRDGKGALLLWPAFGAINQLLAALTLVVATVYLIKQKTHFLVTAIPMAFMLFVIFWGALYNLRNYIDKKEMPLLIITGVTLALSTWMVVETAAVLIRNYRQRNHP